MYCNGTNVGYHFCPWLWWKEMPKWKLFVLLFFTFGALSSFGYVTVWTCPVRLNISSVQINSWFNKLKRTHGGDIFNTREFFCHDFYPVNELWIFFFFSISVYSLLTMTTNDSWRSVTPLASERTGRKKTELVFTLVIPPPKQSSFVSWW